MIPIISEGMVMLPFQVDGRLSIQRVGPSAVIVTVTDLMCFEGGTLVAQAVFTSFGSKCLCYDTSSDNPLVQTYVFMIRSRRPIRNLYGYARRCRKRLVQVVAVLDDLERLRPVV